MKKSALTIVILIVLLLQCAFVFSQVTINYTQDTGLLFLGDDKGNSPGTYNASISSEWRGFQQRFGYMYMGPEFEYADLKGGIFRRYSVNAGYSFTVGDFLNLRDLKIYANNGTLFGIRASTLEMSAAISYGIIDYNGGWRGFGAKFQTSVEVYDGVEFFIELQILDRQDQKIYGEKYLEIWQRVRGSGKAGFKFILQ